MNKYSHIPPFFSNAVSILLLTSPILKTYGFTSIDFSIIFTSLFIGIFLLKRGVCNSMPKWLAIYFGYNILILILSFSITPIEFLRVLYALLAYMMFFDVIKLDSLLKYYKIVAIICISFFYIQEIFYYTIGYRISGLMTFLPLSLGIEDTSSYFEHLSIAERSSSFFSEPSHFAQFLLPLFALILLEKQKVSYRWAIIIFITLLLLQSGNAMIGMLAIVLVYIRKIFSTSSARVKMGGFACCFLLLIVGYFYVTSIMGERLLERQSQVSGEMEHSSGFIRVFRGYYVFEVGSLADQIFGTNSRSQVESRIQQSKVSYLFRDNDMYFNMVQSVLIRTGYIGLLIFIVIIVTLWKRNNYQGKAILLAFISLSFTSSLYFSMTMALYLVLAQKIRQQNLCELKSNNF